MTVRLALIGCGAWGWRYVAAARESGEAVVTHIAGARREDDLAGLERVASSDWRKLLDAPVDAFVVATPPASHEEIALAVLARGRPLMIEKPIALSFESACRIASASVVARVPLLVNHVHLFAPAYEELRTTVLGSWGSFTAAGVAGNYGPFRDYSALWDYGPHDVAMFLGLCPDSHASAVHAIQLEGQFRLIVRAGPSSGFFRIWNNAAPKRRVFSVLSAGGSALIYDDLAPPCAKLVRDGCAVPVSAERALTRAVRAFALAAKGGATDWRFDPLLASETTKVLALAERGLDKRRGNDGDDG